MKPRVRKIGGVWCVEFEFFATSFPSSRHALSAAFMYAAR